MGKPGKNICIIMLQVSSFCRQALNICELILHPRAPSLNMPVSHTATITLSMEGTQQSRTSAQTSDMFGQTIANTNLSSASSHDTAENRGGSSQMQTDNGAVESDNSVTEMQQTDDSVEVLETPDAPSDIQNNVTEMQRTDDSVEVSETPDAPSDIQIQHDGKHESYCSDVETLIISDASSNNRNIANINGTTIDHAKDSSKTQTDYTSQASNISEENNQNDETKSTHLSVKRKLEEADDSQDESFPKKTRVRNTHLCTKQVCIQQII